MHIDFISNKRHAKKKNQTIMFEVEEGTIQNIKSHLKRGQFHLCWNIILFIYI